MRLRTAPLLVLLAATAAAAELPLDAPVVSVDLFKNGLALFRREVPLPGDGTFRLAEVPSPVHGTFWVEGPGRIELRTAEREEPVVGDVDPFRDLAGRKIVVHLREPAGQARTGVVVATPKEGAGGRLVLDTESGHAYLDPSVVAWVETPDPPTTVLRKKPVLLLSAEGAGGPSKLRLSWLSRGLSWAPAYRVDLSDPDRLSIRQQAVIRNETESLAGVEVRLVTGYPGIDFDGVVSPLAPGSSWSDFFSSLAGRGNRYGGGRAILAQQAVMSNVASSAGGGAAPSAGDEPTDLHFQSIGKRTLPKGEAIAVDVAEETASYERVVNGSSPTRGMPGAPPSTTTDASRIRRSTTTRRGTPSGSRTRSASR